MKEIYWRVFINTKQIEKAEIIKNQLFSMLKNCKIVLLQVYWKDNSMFVLEYKQKIQEKEMSKILIEMFECISLFSNTWSISLPSKFSNSDFEISGIAERNIKTNGISWVSFILQNNE